MESLTFSLQGLRRFWAGVSLLLLIICSKNAFATAYTYTASGGLSPGSIPLTMNSGDTLEVQSGTMTTSTTTTIGYTVDFSNATTASSGVTITIDKGAVLNYDGLYGGAATINSARDDNNSNTSAININGTLDCDTSIYALWVRNSAGTGVLDEYNINIASTAQINGSIVSNGVYSANVNITGSPTINGKIGLATASTGQSSLLIGANATSTFTPTETIENIGNLHITNSSTLNLNVQSANINNVTIDAGSTLNLGYNLVGLLSSDGRITNNGTMIIGAQISKTGGFSGIGTNIVTEGGSTGLNIETSTYQIANHIAVLQDQNNYGNINLTTANFNLNNGNTNLFSIEYGTGYNGTNYYSYPAGYFAGGTYTLVTVETGTLTTPTFNTTHLPTSTLFLSFNSAPVVNGNTIQITLSRTPFNSFAQNPLTQAIASNLEAIGASSPAQSMLDILDAVELSTTATDVEYSLRQLSPLANAPYYSYQVQDDSMNQVHMRLADVRNKTGSYIAGDLGRDTHIWTRYMGAYANQLPKDDSFGYYGVSGGAGAGIDRNLDDNYTLGAAFIYVLSHVNDKVNPASYTQIKTYIAMGYGTYNFSDTEYLDWILAVTANQFAGNRAITINTYSQVATSSYGSQQIAFNGVLGKNYEAFGFMLLTPEAFAQYMFAKQYSYQEQGAGAANLTISRTNTDMVTLGIGGKAAIPALLDPGVMIPEIHGYAFYNPVTGKQNTIFSFVDAGAPITSIFNPSRTGFTIGAALSIGVIDRLEVKLNFDYEVEDRFNSYCAYINLKYVF